MENKKKLMAAFAPRTVLGRKLWSLRKQTIKSGVKLLNADEISEELKRRRGGLQEEEVNNE